MPDTSPANVPPVSGPSAPIVREEGPLATGERFRPFALAALTLVLIGLCVYILLPFLPAITWGVALAVIAWPLHTWVTRRTDSRTGGALLTTAVVVFAIAVPGILVTREIALEAASAADEMGDQQAKTTVRAWLASKPGMDGVVRWIDRSGVDVDAEARKVSQAYLGDLSALAQGSLVALFQAALAVFILFYMLRDRNELLAAVRQLMPMRRAETDRVFARAATSVYANLYAGLVTSAIDGFTGGLLFWALGLPSPVMWGVVMFVLSLLPVAGIFLVWVPAAVYLAVVDNWTGAGILVAWGVVTSILIDTLLYTRLAGGRMRLHEVPALLAFVGGLAVFGASGIILGPAILAVTVAVMEVWHARASNEEIPEGNV